MSDPFQDGRQSVQMDKISQERLIERASKLMDGAFLADEAALESMKKRCDGILAKHGYACEIRKGLSKLVNINPSLYDRGTLGVGEHCRPSLVVYFRWEISSPTKKPRYFITRQNRGGAHSLDENIGYLRCLDLQAIESANLDLRLYGAPTPDNYGAVHSKSERETDKQDEVLRWLGEFVELNTFNADNARKRADKQKILSGSKLLVIFLILGGLWLLSRYL